MQKFVEINNQQIFYILKKNKHSKSVRFTIYPGGKFVVTAPAHISEKRIEKYIVQKAEWIFKKIKFFSEQKIETKQNDRKNYILHKGKARILAKEKVVKFAAFYKASFLNINIKNSKTRWGSCSKKGNLNFNYKIVFLPEEMIDYIVVHEVCHLIEFNHSEKFWNEVARTIPKYREIRRDLKRMKL